MVRFGGQTVGKGSYWSMSGGEGIEVSDKAVLPGDSGAKYLKLRAGGMFMLGPLFGLLFVCLVPFISLLATVLLLTRTVSAAESTGSDEAVMCLGCHSGSTTVKKFMNGEKLLVAVSENHFKGTVHGFVSCTGCHSSVSMDTHPTAKYGSKHEFALQVSKACRACHPDEQLLAKPIHGRALNRANAPPCSDCHGSHSVRKVTEFKKEASNSQYCLTCHKQNLSLLLNGETLSLTIDPGVLKKSVHKTHDCSDCHAQFSKKTHPIKDFANRRELSISISNACKGCHTEKAAQFQGSVHFSLMKEGNRGAPVCTDCHGAHSVGPKAIIETMSGVPCRKCHKGIFDDYQASVHGKAKLDGKIAAPLCSSCHFAHEVKPTLVSKLTKAACMQCHKNIEDAHNKWLPNTALHLDAVACTVCHVPNAERTVYLHVANSESGEIVSDTATGRVVAASFQKCRDGGDACIEDQQMWDIYQRLGESKTKVNFRGSIGLVDSKMAHQLAPKEKAIRKCDRCHSAGSDFFKKVVMAIITTDRKESLYNVNPKVLGSFMSALPLNQFYVMGSTRIIMLDVVGALLVLGGVSFPLVHISARVLTRRVREEKKKGGRK